MATEAEIERLARFLHEQRAAEVERDDMQSIPSFEEYRDQWLDNARAVLAFLGQ